MKITDMRIAVVAPWDPRFRNPVPKGAERWVQGWEVIWVRLGTDQGLSGDAFAWGAPTGRAGAELLARSVRPVVLGAEATAREALWHRLRRLDRLTGLFPKYLLSVVDVALWDLAGKAADLPLHRLLGSYRERVPVQAASLFLEDVPELVDQAEACQAAGFRAFKAHLWGEPEKDLRACRELRRRLGADMRLMVDLHGTYTRQQARWVGERLEELDLDWLEEPIPDDDLQGYVQLCRELRTPIAGMQSLAGHLVPLAEYLAQRAVDIVLADASWKAGITGLRKLAHACEVFGLPCEIHSGFNALMSVANLHALCAGRHGTWYEHMVPEGIFDFGVIDPPRVGADGCVAVPERPGLGLELDEEFLARHTVERL